MVAIIPFAALAACLVALMVLYATGTFARAVASFIPNWHIPGLGHLRDAVVAGISHALGWIGNFMDDTIHSLAYFFHALVVVPTRLFQGVVEGIAAAGSTATWIVNTYVPRELGKVRSWTAAKVAAAAAVAAAATVRLAHTVAADYAAARSYAHGLVAALSATVARDFAAAKAYTVAKVSAAERDIAAGVLRAEAAARAAVAAATGKLAADIARVDARVSATAGALSSTISGDVIQLEKEITAAASSATAAALGVISTDIEHAIASELKGITDAIGAAEGVAAGDFAEILDWVRGIDLSKVTDIAGVTTLAIGVTGALTRYLEKCGMPNCRNLSGFGRELQALLGLVGDAELLALFIELATNPEDAAREFVAVIDGPMNATIHAARSLLGVG